MHYYAWRGGPKIEAVYGTNAFIVEFAAHIATRDKPNHHAGTLQELINQYQHDESFKKLKPVTQKGYIQRIRHIEAKFGKLPIKALNSPRVRTDFLEWRSDVAKTNGVREADYRITLLAVILSWALHFRKIDVNQLEKPKRLYSGSRVDSIWTTEDIAKFRAVAPAHVELPFTLGLETGQRQLNILKLRWTDYDGTYFRVKQTKGGRHVIVRVLPEMRKRLDALRVKQSGPYICLNSEAKPWTSDGFKTSFGKAKEKAGIKHLTFHDTRGTAVVILAEAGSTLAEIASVTGHSMLDAAAIIQANYLGSSKKLSDSAISKVEAYLASDRVESGGE